MIDDPVKDRAEANSATIRNSIWDWYTSTAYTRLSPGGGVIVMATRWNLDDLIGRLIENMNTGAGDTFTVINYPAIAENDEPHRNKGEALHPERYDLSQLEKIRKTIGSRDWAALYQQHPIPDGGSIFKAEWIKYWTDTSVPAQFDQQLISWDMTFKDSKNSDYVVGQVWGKKGADFYQSPLLFWLQNSYNFVTAYYSSKTFRCTAPAPRISSFGAVPILHVQGIRRMGPEGRGKEGQRILFSSFPPSLPA